MRLVVLCIVSLATTLPAWSQVPAATDAKSKDLLARLPFDRITLPDDTTWDIEPLSPRPLPPIDSKKSRRSKQSAEPPRDGNIGLIGSKPRPEVLSKEEEDEAAFITVHMLEGEDRDFKVKRENIKSVSYFEDLLIAEANRLISAGNPSKAFEYLLATKARQPTWPGLADAVDRLLFEEGSQALNEGEGESGLRLLGELYARRPTYPGLGDKLAASFASRIRRAFDVGLYAKGRQILHEVEAIAASHPSVKEARARFELRALELANRAKAVEGPDRLDLLLAAAQVWPQLDGLETRYREAFGPTPTLDVAIADLPSPVGPSTRTSASARSARLLYEPILASLEEPALKGEVTGQLAAGIESFDLSRGLRVKIKPGFTWGDGSRPVAALDVARSLADRTVPGLPGYSARWADLLDRVEATEDDRVEIRLTRPTLRPEVWLLAPVGPAHAGPDGWVASTGEGRRPIGDGPYRWRSSRPAIDQYTASTRPGRPTPKVARIREVRFDSPGASVAAFVRGEVSMIEAVEPDRLADLKSMADARVGQYTTPSLHLIAIDGRNESLRNRSVRRGLSMAIDRRTLLEETVLRRPPDEANTVIDGPLLKGSYGDVAGVLPFEYNPLLAQMLVAAARKELGGAQIRLVLLHPPTAVARAVCPKFAEAWKLVGLDVTLQEVSVQDLENRLRSGERYDLAYRSPRPGDPAFDVGPLICPGYDAPSSADALASVASPRILQLLLQLDRAPETTLSQSLVRQIDRESRDELPILPLWQLVDHYAWRSRVVGPVESIGHLYDGIETWEVKPWYPRDPW